MSDEQKNRVRAKLANRINSQDELVVTSEEQRSQLQNRQLAIVRLHALVNQALHVPKKRKATRPTLGSKIRRIESKKIRSKIKTDRRSVE